MSRQITGLEILFGFAGGALLLFLAAPLAQILFATSPASLWSMWGDPEVLVSVRQTFLAALAAVGFGLLTGVPLAYLLARRRFRGQRLISAAINLPVIIPHTAAGIALLLVFGRRGPFGRILAPLGITFVESLPGIIVAMTFVGMPFLVNAARQTFDVIDVEYELAALADGATRWQAFRFVTLPQAWPAILSGAVLMWARGISEFGAVVILAYHPKVIPVVVYERFQGFGLAAAQPVAALLILVALVAFAAFGWLSRSSR